MVSIVKMVMPSSQYETKCPYATEKKFIVVHNTANSASAKNEAAYMIRNSNEVSFHVAIDDVEIIEVIPENRNAWHAGDGSQGQGNLYGYSIEICYSLNDSDIEKFKKAEINAAQYIAYTLNRKGWGIDKVKKHQDFSGKYCPHRTLDMGWQRFLNMVSAELEKLKNATIVNMIANYKLLTTVRGYKTADDARKRVNPVNCKAAGSYFVYKTVDGAVNISTNAEVAGSWINPLDNKAPVTRSIAVPSAIGDRPAKQFSIGENVRICTYLWLNNSYVEGTRQGIRVANPGEYLKIKEFHDVWGKAYDYTSKRDVWFNLKYCK